MWLVSCCTEKNKSFICSSFNIQSQIFTHLIEDFLQVGGTHTVSQVSVGRMWEKELSLSSHSSSDVFLSIDVLLAPVHHTDVTWKQGFARVPLWWSPARMKLMTWNFLISPSGIFMNCNKSYDRNKLIEIYWKSWKNSRKDDIQRKWKNEFHTVPYRWRAEH